MRGCGGTYARGQGQAAAAALIVLLAAAILLALSPGPAAASAGGIVSHELDAGGSSFFSTGFSRAQIRRAKPLPLPELDVPAARAASTASTATAEPSGKPGYVEGTLPAGAAIGSAALQAGASARGFGKFSSDAVADPTVFPNTTNGKVIGKIKGIGLYSCSASVVHAKNRNTIFTAGHCVKEPGGRFASKLAFAPAYSDGAAPLGAWTGKRALVPKAWTVGNNNYDYAAVAMKPSHGRKLEKLTGSKGFAYNIPVKRKNFRAVGYPFNKDRTNTMWECVSGFGGYDPGYRGGPGPSPFGIGCDMSSGASGGGWTVPGEYLASVSSFTYDQLPNRLFGPRFSKAADRLRAAAGRFKVG